NSGRNQATRRCGVVDSSYTGDINRLGIENRLTPRYRRPSRMLRKFRPLAKRIENGGGKNIIAASHKSSRQLQRGDYRVDARVNTDKKWLRNERQRPAIGSVGV